MKWIWERPDWPNFRFDAAAFIQLEREFHRNTGLIGFWVVQKIKETEEAKG